MLGYIALQLNWDLKNIEPYCTGDIKSDANPTFGHRMTSGRGSPCSSPPSLTVVPKQLQDHVRDLEEKIQMLRAQLSDPHRDQLDRDRIETELRYAELALTGYRAAIARKQGANQCRA